MIETAVLHFAVDGGAPAGSRSFDGGVIAVSNQCSSRHEKESNRFLHPFTSEVTKFQIFRRREPLFLLPCLY